IRGYQVTGVQTCALPIYFARLRLLDPARFHDLEAFRQEEQQYEVINKVVRRLQETPDSITESDKTALASWLGEELDELLARDNRSEERRVGKEGRYRRAA